MIVVSKSVLDNESLTGFEITIVSSMAFKLSSDEIVLFSASIALTEPSIMNMDKIEIIKIISHLFCTILMISPPLFFKNLGRNYYMK